MRVRVGQQLRETDATMCFACREPLTPADRCHPSFEEGARCPFCARRGKARRFHAAAGADAGASKADSKAGAIAGADSRSARGGEGRSEVGPGGASDEAATGEAATDKGGEGEAAGAGAAAVGGSAKSTAKKARLLGALVGACSAAVE